jgi:phospholipid/cholesterol/gamma-HCH transport system substrate-binding protein
MATLQTKFFVGIFLVVGFAIAVIGIVWLGMSHYLEKGLLYTAFFDESVQGLENDSSVKYRGVSVGRVTRIDVAPDAKLIQVILKIEKELRLEEDMVAQLKSIGITGIMFIEISRKSPDEPDLSPPITFPVKYPVLSTKPSGIKQFIEGVNEVLDRLKVLDLTVVSQKINLTLDQIRQTVEDARIGEISKEIRSTFERLEKVIDDSEWRQLIAAIQKASLSFDAFSINADKTVSNFNKTLAGFNKTIAKVNKILQENEKGIHQAVLDVDRVLKRANGLLKDGSGLIRNTDERIFSLQYQFAATLKNIETALENLNRFLELISDDPSQLFFGGPPPAKRVK